MNSFVAFAGMLGLGETLARRRGLLRAMKSLRGLADHYRLIVFSARCHRLFLVARWSSFAQETAGHSAPPSTIIVLGDAL